MLELLNISWSVPEGRKVLRNVSLSIPDSGLTVITGPNGGGKTTLAKIIAGIIKPDSGRIILNGEDITELDVTERARKGIAYAFQQPVRFKGITVRDLLEIAYGKNLPESELCMLLQKVGLCARDYRDRYVNSSLSGGEIKRVEIAYHNDILWLNQEVLLENVREFGIWYLPDDKFVGFRFCMQQRCFEGGSFVGVKAAFL